MASGIAGIIVTDRSGAICGGSVDEAAFRQSRHQPATPEQRHADRNSERYHRTRHRFLWLNCAGQNAMSRPRFVAEYDNSVH
jgi:hypothetical protein